MSINLARAIEIGIIISEKYKDDLVWADMYDIESIVIEIHNAWRAYQEEENGIELLQAYVSEWLNHSESRDTVLEIINK